MSAVYDDHRDDDGFLYIAYSGENTFGSALDLDLIALEEDEWETRARRETRRAASGGARPLTNTIIYTYTCTRVASRAARCVSSSPQSRAGASSRSRTPA
eukprot:8834-Pelagococcus_subviridis.AAC.3